MLKAFRSIVVALALSTSAHAAYTIADNYAPLRYTASASQTAFSVTWPFDASSDLVVKTSTDSGATWTTRVLNTDYTVTGAATTAGGTVTFNTGRAASELVLIYRNDGIDRTSNFTTLTATGVELAFDRMTLWSQQVEQVVEDRCLLLPDTENTVGGGGSAPVSNAIPSLRGNTGKVLGVNAGEVGFTFYDLETGEQSSAITRVYRVLDYGATCDGSSDDTQEIQAALDACEAVGGCRLEFPAGKTCVVSPPAADTPVFTIGSNNITFWMRGATIKATGATGKLPTTYNNELAYGYVFHATGKDNLRFLGGTFDGNRDAAINPHLGFLRAEQCDDLEVRGMSFAHTSHGYGFIHLTPVRADGGAGARYERVTIADNDFTDAPSALWALLPVRHLRITGNRLRALDLVDVNQVYYGYLSTYGSGVVKPRGIAIYGYAAENPDTLGDTEFVSVTDNDIEGAYIATEFWNSDATYARDPEKVRDCTFDNNRVHALGGIYINYLDNPSISRNHIRLNTPSEVAAYAGRTFNLNGVEAAITNFPEGSVCIEARPGANYHVEGNVLDGQWAWESGNPGEYPKGVAIGAGSGDADSSATIINNTFRNLYAGVQFDQAQNTTIASNLFQGCGIAVRANGANWDTRVSRAGFTFGNNVLRNNDFFAAAPLTTATGPFVADLVSVEGEWAIQGNRFYGIASMGTGTTLLRINNFDKAGDDVADLGNFVVKGNVFSKYQRAPIRIDSAIRVHLEDNFFDSEESSPSSSLSALRIERPDTAVTMNSTMTLTGARNMTSRTPVVVTWKAPAGTAGTESYDFGEWRSPGTVQTQFASGESGYSTDAPLGVAYTSGDKDLVKRIMVDMTGGANTVDVSGFVPTNSVVTGATIRIVTAVTGSGGLATLSIGYTGAATDADAWGAGIAVAANTVTRPSDWTAFPVRTGSSALTLRFTANGAETISAGRIAVQLAYRRLASEFD